MRQQAPCYGAGVRVAPRASSAGQARYAKCPKCLRSVALNFDGTLRRHVAKLLRFSNPLPKP